MRHIRFCIAAFVCATLAAARAETYGPQVDVTLHNGDSTRGQLVSYSDGSLTIKLDNGNLVTQDGSAVLTLRFLATEKPAVAPPPLPSSQETELTMSEEQRVTMYR
ncbi:MAG TPA: hypothetical protein VKX17_25735, partial [Planctomycetota bacterium]|nr:hypothetical protein [Planctomycetota bacterium]